jgi:hypothetical protein
MLPENQTNKAPDKPYAQTIPKSQQDSGTNLDEACGDIEQAEGGLGLDKAIRKLDRK